MTHRWIIKLVREVVGYLVLGSIALTSIILYSQVGVIPDAILGALLTGTISGICWIATNGKEPKNDKKGEEK